MKSITLLTISRKEVFGQESSVELLPFKVVAIVLLVISSAALLFSPMLMPADYFWMRNTTSESAAQGVTGAWLARFGFLIFGLTVIWIAHCLRDRWPPAVRWLQAAFGVFMVAAAVFSKRAWMPNVVYDPVEDWLHSFAATAMGFAFTIGVLLMLLRRGGDWFGRLLDIVAAVAAVAIPLAMLALPEWDGLIQRCMFAISYFWFALEVLRGSYETAFSREKNFDDHRARTIPRGRVI